MKNRFIRPLLIAALKPGSYDFFDEFHADTAHGRIGVK